MEPNEDDVRSMVIALFTLISRVERARRQRKPAAALDLLQVIAASEEVRPSDIADQRSVHRSLVTRQLREMEDAGYVQFREDPDDGRLGSLRLRQLGATKCSACRASVWSGSRRLWPAGSGARYAT